MQDLGPGTAAVREVKPLLVLSGVLVCKALVMAKCDWQAVHEDDVECVRP